MDDEEFVTQLDELLEAAKAETAGIKQLVAKIVKTYSPKNEEL